MRLNSIHSMLAVPWRWTSLWSGSALRRARGIKQPRILMYHILGDGEVSPSQFEWQLRFLRRHFEPITLTSLLDRIDGNATSGFEVALTFDDGVRDQFTTAWPLLRKYQVPATFFVCPGLIESGNWLWRTELRMRLAFLDDAQRMALAESAGCPVNMVEPIMEWTKTLDPDARTAFEQRVAQHTRKFRPNARQREQHAPLTWEQIREMDPALVTIGSHTSTHPILTALPTEALESEISGSRTALEQALGRRIDLFSYPNGANDAIVVATVRQHYRAAVTTRKHVVAQGDNRHLLPRIPAGDDRATFTRRLHKPTA